MLILYIAPTDRLILVSPQGQQLEYGRDQLPRRRGEYVPIRDGGGLVGWVERTRGGAGNVGVTLPVTWRVFSRNRLRRRQGGQACSA